MDFPNKKYRVIYADPPWAYRQCGTGKKSRGTALKHYPTMTTDEICALPVQNICMGKSLSRTAPILGRFNARRMSGAVTGWRFVTRKLSGFRPVRKPSLCLI